MFGSTIRWIFFLVLTAIWPFEVFAQTTSAGSAPDISTSVALLFAFIGGIILNLMPCVFPILSIKALGVVKMYGSKPGLAAAQGIAYTIGIIITFIGIASVLVLLKQAGAMVGWGFHLQNPATVMALAWLLFLIGLGFSGIFPLEFSLGQGFGKVERQLEGRSLVAGSFFAGILVTFVATPCTAPFMGVAIGFAITQGPIEALLIFGTLGLGLALPFLLLSLLPPLQKMLPRPGAWMVTFQQFLAFPMYASSVWLVWVLSKQAGPQGVLYALSGMVGIGFAIWLLGKRPEKGGRKILLYAWVVMVLVPVFGSLAALQIEDRNYSNNPEIYMTSEAVIGPWSPEKLDRLLHGDRPVFVEMTADWCIICKVNNKVALHTPAIKKLFARKEVMHLVGDWTRYNERITGYMESFGRTGVPLYVYYAERDQEAGRRPEPVVLPQVLTPSILKGAVSDP